MHTVASDSEWAETLLAIAGDNAANAARRFARENYESGRVALALVWSRVAYAVDDQARAISSSRESSAPVPARFARLAAAAERGIRGAIASSAPAKSERAGERKPRHRGRYRRKLAAAAVVAGIEAARRTARDATSERALHRNRKAAAAGAPCAKRSDAAATSVKLRRRPGLAAAPKRSSRPAPPRILRKRSLRAAPAPRLALVAAAATLPAKAPAMRHRLPVPSTGALRRAA